MSFADDYFNELNKKKKKKQSYNSDNGVTAKNDYASEYFAALNEAPSPRTTALFSDDIAPVSFDEYKERPKTIETTQAIYDKYGKYYHLPDYDEYSKKGADIENPTFNEAEGLNLFGWRPFSKEVSNIVTYSRDNEAEIAMGELQNASMVGKSKYRYMTDFEVGIYNYLLAKEGEKSAQEYLDDIEETLNARVGGQIAEKIQALDPVSSAIMHGTMSVGSGIESFGIGVKQLFSEEALPTTATAFTNQALLEDLDGFSRELYLAGNTVGNMAPSIVVGLINPIAGRILQSSSSAGNAYGQALKEGKSTEEAAAYGVMIGGMEYATSKLLSGVSGMTGKLPEKAMSKIATFENGLLRTGAKYGISLASEITEEEVQLWLEPFARTIAFGEDYDAPTAEEMAETAIVTGISTGILNSTADIATGNLTKVNGLTQHEAKVIEAEVENRIAEEEKSGKKLSSKEKEKIYNDVVEQMDKGQLDIDTIESVLGGETYKTYKNLTEQENTLQSQKNDIESEISDLVKTPETQFTIEQRERLNSLREEARGIEENIKALDTKTAKTNLFDEVYKLTEKDTRLRESYNERARRGQAFEADLTKYKGKQREAVERAIKSGVLNNTNRSHELVNILSTIEADKGIVFDYTDNAKLKEAGFAVEGKTVNGFVKDGGVTLNVQSAKAWQSTVGHEITHVLEGTEAYSALREAVYAYAESKGELASRKTALTELYNGMNADIDAELTADLVGDYLFTNKDFINKLTGNRTLFQKVWDEVKYLCKVATGKELTEIEKVEREFARAWKEQGQTQSEEYSETDDSGEGDITYSISVTDKSTRNFLDEQVSKGEYNAETNPDGGYYVTYKSMSFWGYDEEGNAILRSPMAEYVDGELSNAYLIPKDKSKLNWYQSTETIDENTGLPSGLLVKAKQDGKKSFSYLPASENQHLINEDWSNLYFNLRKKVQKNGKWVNSDVPARYNPYEHSSNSMLNDQFSAAYLRDNLVTVKMYVPVSEDNGTFRAKYSKDATGWADWKTGTVAGKINKQKDLQRKVYLSRYAAPVEIVPDSEVAQAYKEYLDGTDVTIPDNVVSPNLLSELKKAGVPITESGKVKYSVSEDSEVEKGGVSYDETSESYSPVRYSLSTWDKSDYVSERNKVASDMAKALNITQEKATEYIDSVNSIAKMIADDKARLDYEASPERSAFVSNAEYGGSIDFSTICKKRRMFTGTFEAIQNALPNTALTAEEVLEIRKMMKDKGYEVSCGLCYVEGSRANMGQYTKAFIERYKATNPEYVPNMAEMNTATGQEQIRKEHPEVYEAYEYFMNHYGKLSPDDKALFASQQKPKMYQMATEYKGEILDLFSNKEDSVEEKNKNGGLRLQSFSDFEIIHLLDSMQVIMDMSRVGLAGQAYTKVPDFAWALGDTGLKINLSLIAKDVDANGRLVLDEVEGMKESDAMALRNRYSDNVGTILVVFTDEQLKAAMADERIDYIIPYHRSQWKTSQYESMGLPENTKDYTSWQNESYIEPVYNKNGKKQRPDNYMPNAYWDFNKSGKENAEIYLAMCAENNRRPKFSHLLVDNGDGSYSLQPDGSTDGYWKTLIDFKMYNNDGIGVPQNPVTPDFNMEEAQRMLNEYTGGHAQFPVAQDIVDEFVSKHPDTIAPTPGIRYSLSNKGEQFAPIGNYSTPLNETALEQDIAPVATDEKTVSVVSEGVAENATTTNATAEDATAPFPDAISPMTAEEANALQDEKAKADAKLEGDPKTRKQLHNNIINDIKATFSSGGYDFDDTLAKAKDLSTFSTVDNTPQRVMEKALGYKEGQVLADLTVNKVAQNETKGIKWLNSFTDRKNGLLAQISKEYNIKPGSKESAAAQMYAEGFYVDENNEIIEYGDRELVTDFPKENVRNNIKGLAKDPRIRQIYDATLDAINKSRIRNAYPEIQKLDNYFLHFRAMEDTFSKLGLPFNPNDIKAKDLPTDLNGVTADLKPGQPYFASAMHRKGKRTSFDLLGGLERYLTSAKNQIYHIDDIQTLRAVRNYIADTYGQANGLEGIDALTEEEAQERIEQVYGSHLSTFAKFLNEEANILAGKTALIDRGLEGVIGRRGMTFLDTVRKQTGSNMVGFNVSSSLTNFLPVAQTLAKSNKFDFLKAFTQTASNKLGSIFGKGDNFAENSPVMIRRKGADRFYRTPFQKVGDTGYFLMGAVDNISTELIARTKFNELTRKGMSEQQAHIETDKWVSRLMGDRSLGQMPQLYNSKTLGFITQFQLEVRNQLDSQFYDTIQEAKVSNEEIENNLARNAKTAAKVTSTFVQLAVVQHLFGKAFESVAGYNPAFDIIEVLSTMFGFDDEEDDEDTALDNLSQGFLELLEDLPYTSAFTGGGRIPMSAALPISEVITGKDSYGNEKSRLETLGETIPYYVLPGGYGQIKKTTQGLGMFSDEHPIAGSYTDSGNLRFPVEDTPLNRVQAALFGQYASKNAREYFDNDYAPLKEKQIQEYIDVDLPIADYWKYREGLSKLQPLEGKESVTLNQKGDYIGGLDLPVSKKNILINNIADDRKTPIDFTGYENYADFEEFDFAQRFPEKYAVLKEQGISVADYKEKYEEAAFMYTDDFAWASNNPERYALSKVVTNDVTEYKRYTTDLYNIKADKDENGKSINGSRKEKVLDYINNLDADYEAKIILWKSEYPSDDTYNMDIINYINERGDLTYEERIAIFTELGFTVENGTVYW